MRKLIASVAAVTAIAVGGFAVAALNPLAAVSAKSANTATRADGAPKGGHGHARGKGLGRHKGKKGRARPGAHVLNRALAKLVKKGTITEAQAKAVKEGVRGEARALGKRVVKGRKAVLETSATAIGIAPEALKEALKGGQSIAQVAKAHGVDPQKVVDALVAAGNAKVDEAVKAGKVPAERAGKIKQRLPKVAKRIVERAHR